MVKLVTDAAEFPVSLDEAKEHLRVTGTDEDSYLTTLLHAATDAVEEQTGRQLGVATYELTLEAFPPGPIDLPRPPLVSVESITYVDTDGVSKTWEEYLEDTARSQVVPSYGMHWPSTRAVPGAVKVRYQTGYSDVPFSVRAAVLLTLADLYENREGQGAVKLHQNVTVDRLLSPYRVY